MRPYRRALLRRRCACRRVPLLVLGQISGRFRAIRPGPARPGPAQPMPPVRMPLGSAARDAPRRISGRILGDSIRGRGPSRRGVAVGRSEFHRDGGYASASLAHAVGKLRAGGGVDPIAPAGDAPRERRAPIVGSISNSVALYDSANPIATGGDALREQRQRGRGNVGESLSSASRLRLTQAGQTRLRRQAPWASLIAPRDPEQRDRPSRPGLTVGKPA